MNRLLTDDDIGMAISEIKRDGSLAQWNWATWREIAIQSQVKTLKEVGKWLRQRYMMPDGKELAYARQISWEDIKVLLRGEMPDHQPSP